MKNELLSEISIKIEGIQEIFKHLNELRDKVRQCQPALFEQMAIGTLMINFYNRMENIFKRVVRYKNLNLPKGERWHAVGRIS